MQTEKEIKEKTSCCESTCCGDEKQLRGEKEVKENVKEKYSQGMNEKAGCGCGSSCCSD